MSAEQMGIGKRIAKTNLLCLFQLHWLATWMQLQSHTLIQLCCRHYF